MTKDMQTETSGVRNATRKHNMRGKNILRGGKRTFRGQNILNIIK